MSLPLDLPQVVSLLAELLEGLRVPYAFGGAIALNYWGTVRATEDIDLLISVPRVRFEEVRQALAAAGVTMLDEKGNRVPLTVKAMVEEERNRHLITVYRDSVKVEMFFPFLPIQSSILKRAVKLPLGGKEVPVTTAEDMILLKLAFHREKDLLDVRSILWNQKDRLDLAYLRDWAARMLAPEVVAELEGWVRRYVQTARPAD